MFSDIEILQLKKIKDAPDSFKKLSRYFVLARIVEKRFDVMTHRAGCPDVKDVEPAELLEHLSDERIDPKEIDGFITKEELRHYSKDFMALLSALGVAADK